MDHPLFNVETAVDSACNRIGDGKRVRKIRTDAGGSKLAEPIASFLSGMLSGYDRPPMKELLQGLAMFCAKNGEATPSRITVYRFIENAVAPVFKINTLPGQVREALYNLGDCGDVPGGQLAFYCFNYGGVESISFASGLPWLCLYQAAKISGHRPQARALLEAVMKTRGI